MHDSIAKAALTGDDDSLSSAAKSGASEPRKRQQSLLVGVPVKTALHAWGTRVEHGYTTFDDLELGAELGEGGFSTVRVGTNRSTGARFAVKEAPHKAGHDPELDPDDADMLCDEARILRRIFHASVVHCYDVVVRPDRCFLVLELMEGGELFDRIVAKRDHHYTEAEARRTAYVLLNAVAYLGRHGVVHRDLKPENLLLQHASNDHDFKIADFGLAQLLADNEGGRIREYAGAGPGGFLP